MKIFEPQVRPIDQWPGPLTKNRRPSPFKSGYGDTMNLLARELHEVGAKSPVLLMALTERDIRLDGRPRADAKPLHPGVILTFSTSQGAMRFPCDTFVHWQDNIRAIALALEALRKVDRYGVTKRGEQYTGWKALPAPPVSGMQTREQALEALRRVIGGRADSLPVDSAIREAEMLTHPDCGGNVDDFKKVQEARKLLLA